MSELVSQVVALENRLEVLEAQEGPVPSGWHDDFFGNSLHEQYAQTLTGASTITLLNNQHGGAVELRAQNGIGDASILWLGPGIDGIYTLTSTRGWAAIVRFKLSATTSVRFHHGAATATGLRRIFFGADTDLHGNWIIELRSGAGWMDHDTGVPIDTNWHVAKLEVQPDEVNLILDGVLIGTESVNLPADYLMPVTSIATLAAGLRHVRLDYWDVIPLEWV